MELQTILNDRGYRKAIEKGWIKVEPQPEDVQFQPASLDLHILGMFHSEPLTVIEPNNPLHRKNPERYPHVPYNMKTDNVGSVDELLIPSFSKNVVQVDTVHFPPVSLGSVFDSIFDPTNMPPYLKLNLNLLSLRHRLESMYFSTIFTTHDVVLRSSMGRLNLAAGDISRISDVPFQEVNDDGSPYGMGIFLINYSPYSIKFEKGDRIAQMFTEVQQMALVPVKLVEAGIKLPGQLIKEVHDKGLFRVSPELDVDDFGYIVLHAGDTAYRMKEPQNGQETINFSERKNLEYERVGIPEGGLVVEPFEYWAIQAAETLKLSEHIGINFVGFPLTPSYAFRSNFDFFDSFLGICNAGWFDPGYSGVFLAHPKTLQRQAVIKRGDPIGWGRVYIFENGVERPYGSAQLGSRYQEANSFALK